MANHVCSCQVKKQYWEDTDQLSETGKTKCPLFVKVGIKLVRDLLNICLAKYAWRILNE